MFFNRVGSRKAGRIAITALAFASIVALAGCSAAASNTAGAKTVLTVYGWKGGGTELANVAQVNQAFEKANPSIQVKFQYIRSDPTYTQRVQPELLAGNSADVLMTDGTKVNTWGKAGYLADLSSESWTKNVLPAAKPFITAQSKVYAEPMELIGISLYANNTLLKKAGIDQVPITWADFNADLQKVKQAGITPISLPNKNAWTGEAALNAIAASLVYTKDKNWDANFVAGKANFSDWSDSLAQLMSLQANGYVNFKDELGVDEWSSGLSDFTAGKSAFYFQGAWNQTAIAQANVSDSFIPWPATSGSKPTANLFAGTMWSINAKTKVKSAAQKYLQFWADSKNAAPYLTSENAIAPFAGAKSPSTPATSSFVAAVESGNYRILPSDTWFKAANETTMGQRMQALWLGQITQKQFLDDMNQLR